MSSSTSRAAETPADLESLRATLAPALKRLGRCARVVVIGRDPALATSPAQRAARRALEGITRSVAKELRAGATANLVLVADGSEGAVLGTVTFLLSGPVGLRRRPGVPCRGRRGRARAGRPRAPPRREGRRRHRRRPRHRRRHRPHPRSRRRHRRVRRHPRLGRAARRRRQRGRGHGAPGRRHRRGRRAPDRRPRRRPPRGRRRRRPQRRHHPRQAPRQHRRRPLGRGPRGQPPVDPADERGVPRPRRAARRRPRRPRQLDRGHRRQPRAGQLRRVQGRRHRAGRRLRRGRGAAVARHHDERGRPGLHRDRDDRADPARHPRDRAPAQQPQPGRPAGRRRRDDRLLRGSRAGRPSAATSSGSAGRACWEPDVAVETLGEIPSTAPLLAKAAVTARGRRGDTVPDRTLRVEGVRVDRERLVAYQRLCGYAVGDTLPAAVPVGARLPGPDRPDGAAPTSRCRCRGWCTSPTTSPPTGRSTPASRSRCR